MSFDAGSVEARLVLSRDDFNRELDAAKADADKFTSKPIKATVTADGTQAKATLDDLTARADKLSGKAGTITVRADATQADATLDKTSAKADALGKKAGTIKVQADASQANTEMDRTSAKADALGGKTPTVKVKADTAAANADLDKTALKADALGRKTETVKVKTDTDTSGIDGLSKKISDLTSGPFSLLKTAIVGLGPAAVPVLGAVTAAVLPLTAALGSAAAGLGAFGIVSKAVLGEASKASTAAGAAQSTYTAAIAKAAGQYQIASAAAKTHTQQVAALAAEHKADATAAVAQAAALGKAYAGMSSQQIALSKQVGDLSTAYKGMLTSVTPLVSSALVPWIKDIQAALQYVKPLITDTAGLFKSWGTEIGQALAGNQANISRFIDVFAGRSATNIRLFGDALVEFAKGAGALIHDIAPNLSGAAGGIVKLATSFAEWAKSKKTADDIKGFFAWAKSEAPAVKKFLEELATSVGHLIQAMAFSGGGDLKVLTVALSGIAALPAGAIVAIADGFVAISLGLRAATAAMGAWNIVSTIAKGIQAALNDEIKVTGAELVVQKIVTLAMAAAQAVEDAAETVYIALMLVADAVSAPLIVVIGGVVLALAGLAFGIYELVTHWTASWHAILAAADAVWAALKVAFSAVVTFFTVTVPKIPAALADAWHTVAAGVTTAWNAIASFFTSWWNSEVAYWKGILSSVTSFFKAAWNTVRADVASVWNAIKSWFSSWWSTEISSWKTIISQFTAFFKAGWTTVKNDAATVWNAIKSFFTSWWSTTTTAFKNDVNAIASALHAAWNGIESTAKSVFGGILTFFGGWWSALKSGFASAVSGVKTAWDKIESIVKTPIRWVVTNVYDKLIVPFWNATAGAVGLHKLPKLAGGGMVPGGYSPVDNQLVWMRSGEGVLQPGAVMALGGPAFIDAANRAYGDVPVGSAPPGHYAPGGVAPGNVGQGLHTGTTASPSGPALGPIPGLVHDVAGIVADVESGIFDTLSSIGTKLIGDATKLIPGTGGVATAMRDYPPKIWSAFLAWVTAHAPKGNAGDIVAYARTFLGKIPYTWGGTGLKADDCSGFTEAIYEHFGYNAPRTSEAQGAWVKKTKTPQAGGLAFFNSPAGGPPPGHVGIVIGANSMISQAGPQGALGPTLSSLAGNMFTGIPPGGFKTGAGGVAAKSGSAAAAQSYARSLLAQYHWASSQFSPLLALWNQESGWNDNAVNQSSGAYGIPQALGKGHPYNLGDYANQVIWGLDYIRDRYGSPAAAEAHEERYGWYDQGGWLQPGASLVMNATGRPEPVLSGDQWDNLSAAMSGGDIGDKLDRIASLLAAQPRATASGVGDVLNGTGRMASFRNRYPRNS